MKRLAVVGQSSPGAFSADEGQGVVNQALCFGVAVAVQPGLEGGIHVVLDHRLELTGVGARQTLQLIALDEVGDVHVGLTEQLVLVDLMLLGLLGLVARFQPCLLKEGVHLRPRLHVHLRDAEDFLGQRMGVQPVLIVVSHSLVLVDESLEFFYIHGDTVAAHVAKRLDVGKTETVAVDVESFRRCDGLGVVCLVSLIPQTCGSQRILCLVLHKLFIIVPLAVAVVDILNQ